MAKPIETVYRDFVTDGNPSTGFHEPIKSDIRDLHNAHLLNLTGALSGAIVKTSLADPSTGLNADLAHDADVMAWVVGDSTQGNDGVYQKQGASGAGSWTRLSDLPYNVIQLNNADAGTANAIQATTAVNVPDAAYGALLVLNITAANTGAVTLSVNGEAAKPIVTNTNAAITSGYFVARMAVICVDDGTSYRLMSYGDASAVQAAAEAAQAAAEAAATASVSSATVTTKTALRAVDTATITKANFDDGRASRIFNWSASDLSDDMIVATETTTSIAGDICTSSAHDLYTGHAVIVSAAVNGLAANTVYYVIRLGVDTFSLASTFLNARAGTAISLSGTTNFTASRLKDASQSLYVIKSGDALDGSDGAWVSQPSIVNASMFGAVGDASTDDLYSLQMAVDFGLPVHILEGRHKISDTLYLDDYCELYFESDKATILYNTTVVKDMVAGRKAGGGAASERNFQIRIHGGLFESNGYGIAVNFLSTSDARLWGTRGYNLYKWALNGGSGSQGAFYNEFYGCEVTALGITAYENGTLGNEVKVFGGRVTDMQIGAADDDNSGNQYIGVAFETFTIAGVRVSNSGNASQFTRYTNCRFENPSTTGSYASASAISVSASGQDTCIEAPQILSCANDIVDSGLRTNVSKASEFNQVSGGTAFKSRTRVVKNKAISSLAANAIRQEQFSVPGVTAGDTVSVVLPATWPAGLIASPVIVTTGYIYVPVYNVSASAISLAAADYHFEICHYV